MSLASSAAFGNTLKNNEQDQIRILLQKIEQGLDEVKYRSINGLHSKIKMKLISVKDLIEYYSDLPGYVMQFINEYQTVAQQEVIQKAIHILTMFSQDDNGSDLLNQYGALEFFARYQENVQGNMKLEQVTKELLANLVQERGHGRTQNFNTTTGSTARFQQTQQTMGLTQTYNLENKENVFGASRGSEIRGVTDKYQTKDFGETGRSSHYGGYDGNQQGYEESFRASARNGFRDSINVNGDTLRATVKPTQNTTNLLGVATMMVTKPKQTYHVESDELIKLKARKEDFFPVVYVPLSEADERYLFDVTVRLKYDNKMVKKILSEQHITQLIRDFPIEALFLQGELLQELLMLVRKSGEDVQYLLTEVYIELLEKMVQTIEMYENPYNGNQKEAKQSDEFLFSDEKNYIKNSYPTLKPVSAEFMEDPAFKKSQETFHFNYFLLLDGIIDATVDLIDNTYFADNINKIWQFVITLLRKYKYKKVELVAEASKDYLRRFVKKLERLDSENLEKRIEYSYLYNILYAMFRMFSIEEYQQMEGYKVDGAIDLLYKGLYRFVFTEKEVDSILSYSQYLAPERHAKYEKVMTLLGSVIRLKHKELDLMKIDVRDIGRDLKELQEIIDLLDRVLMGVPYANLNNFIGLYAEVLLYAQVIEGGFGEQIYTRCRKMLLNLLNVPNVTIRTTLLESLLVNLLTDSQVIYRREGFPKKSLAFQSLLDREIATEILFAGLESEQTINSVAKIFSSFLNIAMADNLNPGRIQHFTNISAMIHCLTSETDPEATGTAPNASKGKYECLRPISEAIYKALPEALLKSLLTDLFSKDRKRRVLALKFLADPLFLKRLHGGNGKQDKLVSEYSEVDNKLRTSKREDDFIKNRGEKDPLEGFLDASSKFFVYKDVADSLEGDYGEEIPDIIMSIEDLMKIASDPAIEYRHRLSSIEQIGEMLRGFLKAVAKPEQLYKKEILVTVERVARLAVDNLIDYCKDRFKEKDSGYIGRILGLTNRIIGTSGLPGDLIWSFVGPLYDLNSEFMRANGIEIISLLVGLLEQRNDTARYHALQALNYLALGFRLSRDNLEDDWKPKMGAMSLRPLQEKFFVVGEFDFVDYVSKHKNFWSFLPLHEDANFFVDCHVVNAQKLNDPQFSVQDQVLDEKCERFCNQIREQSGMRQSKLGSGGQRAENDVLLSCAENWAKTVSTMEFYLPTKLLEIDVFDMLTKIYGSCLTMASMKAESSGIERISGLLNKLLKSESLIKEAGSSEPLLDNIVEFLEFVASNVLGPLYEIQFENAREKMDVVLSALSIINRFLSFALKSKQIKLKHILAKRVVKQSLIDLLHELSTFFNNNEALFLGIGKLAKNLLKFPEIYLVLNLKPLLGNLFDFMFQCSSVENFKSKSLQRWFLRFFLSYSLWEEDSTQAIATRNLSQSLSRLSATSKEIVSKSSCLGWLLKLSEDRETEIRVYAWNLMCNLVNKNVLNDYQSSVETALITLYAPNESYGVVAQAVNYINKTLDLYMNEGLEDFGERGTARSVQFEGEMSRRELDGGDNKQQIDKNELLRKLYRQNIISRLKTMLDSFRCPPVYNSSLIALLRNTCVLNPSKAMPVLNQLEFWDLLVELINPKVFQKRGNGKKMSEWGAASVEVVMLVNNVMQFLIFAMSYDRQVGEYLIYCTQLVKLVIKWLRLTTNFQEKTWYRENPGNSFLIDSCSATLIQVLNLGLFLNEDKTIVMVNKLYEEKIERDSKESRYNIYLLLSKLFSATKNDILILATFRLISNLLPKWQKGSGLLELRDTNGECLSESLILNLFTHYKLNDMVMQDGQISQDDYMEAKNTMTACTCTLLSTSNPAKLSFIYSGFLAYCIKNMEKSTETLLLEDMDTSRMSTTKRTTVRGTHKDQNASMVSMNASRMSFIPGPQTQTPGYDDIKSYLRILKYFFAEATTGDLRQKELYAKLEDQMSMIFDCITKSWKILSRKVDLFQEVAKVLTNFGSNKSINSLCYTKLTHADAKSPILIDVTNTINKFESADKQLLRISFEFVRDMAHGKEVRLFLQRNKTIENCVLKLNKLWNGRKEWTLQNPLIVHIIELFLSLSFWKDSRDRILSDGSLLEELVDLTSKTQMKGRFVEKIWLLISNLAYDKSTKNFFLKYEKIFSAALAILNLDEKSLRLKWISTQFFVNILHKCNAAIAVVKKEHIQDQFFYLKSEMERELDKLTFTNALKEENTEKIAVTKKLLENLSKVTLYVRQV